MAGMEVLMRLQTRATAAEKLVAMLRQQIRESKVSGEGEGKQRQTH